MKITAFIPARGGSKGLPGKNIKELNGVPLLAYAIRAAKNCKHIDEVVVSTDDQAIFDVAVEYGARGVMRTMSTVSDDSATSESVIDDYLQSFLWTTHGFPDVIAFLQCTAPLILSKDIEGCLLKMITGKNTAVFAGAEDYGILYDRTHVIESATRFPRQERTPGMREAGSVYAFGTMAFNETKSRFCDGAAIYEIPANRCYEIDTLQDFKICEFILQNAEELGVEVEDGPFK